MFRTTEDQVIALAGIFQAAYLVDELAKKGTIPEEGYKTCLNSLLKVNADSTLAVFGDRYSIQLGLRELISVLEKQQNRTKNEMVRYTLTLLYLEGKLSKRSDLLDIMGKRIQQIQGQTNHFEVTHSNIVGAFASLYKDTVSTFPQRIQVTGDPKFLRVDENADKIRAILLAGIRAAVLWRQVGGSRWKLIFMRKSVLEIARRLVV